MVARPKHPFGIFADGDFGHSVFYFYVLDCIPSCLAETVSVVAVARSLNFRVNTFATPPKVSVRLSFKLASVAVNFFLKSTDIVMSQEMVAVALKKAKFSSSVYVTDFTWVQVWLAPIN